MRGELCRISDAVIADRLASIAALD